MEKSKFQTEVEIYPVQQKTGYHKNNLFIGSCFTQNMGEKMNNLKYPCLVNPFGVLYNPVSIANCLDSLLENKTFTTNDIFQYEGLWHSFSHHSKFSGKNENDVLAEINSAINLGSIFLQTCNFLFITFGTAWVYQHKSTQKIVANCHKLPEKTFNRFRLATEEIVEIYTDLIDKLIQNNPALQIVFTVSPVRHWKDGAVENQRSKATLILAIDDLIKQYENHSLYFPAYEIIMDELRDYRFYATDMIHISEFATEHIWERFKQWIFDSKSDSIEKRIIKILKAKNHRPFNKFTAEHLRFLLKTKSEVEALQKNYPYLNLTLENNFFNVEIKEIEIYLNKNSAV